MENGLEGAGPELIVGNQVGGRLEFGSERRWQRMTGSRLGIL